MLTASTANRNRHGPQYGGHLSLVRHLERKVTSHAIGIIAGKSTLGGYMNLQVEYMPIGQLLPYAGNAKEHPDWKIEQIEESIETFGFCDPVGVVTNRKGSCVR